MTYLFGMIFSEVSVPFLPNAFAWDDEFMPFALFLSMKYGTWSKRILIRKKYFKKEDKLK